MKSLKICTYLKQETFVPVDGRLRPIDDLVERQFPTVGQNKGHTAILKKGEMVLSSIGSMSTDSFKCQCLD